MGNEGQQAPLPQQGQPGQPPDHYGWQYDQDHPEMAAPPQPVEPPPYAPQQPIRINGVYPSARYQEPIADMGTSLGYNQGSEYQYFNAPQPSQPMAQLRQERLQRLREERMRRQQRRMGPDVTTAIPWKGKNAALPVSEPLQNDLAWGPDGRPFTHANNTLAVPPMQASPVMALPVSDVSSNVVDGAYENISPAAAVAQDTGMLQRVNIQRASLILTGAFIASRILGLSANVYVCLCVWHWYDIRCLSTSVSHS